MTKSDERGSWYLLTGLIIGVMLGVAYSRFFQPLEYVDTDPSTLRQDYKDRYRALIAAAYLSNGDLVRASARLELLKDPDIFRALTEQAQRTLAQDGASAEAQALGLLAIALGQSPPGPGQAVTQAQRYSTGTPVIATPADSVGPTQASMFEPTDNASLETSIGEIASATLSFPVESLVLLSKEEDCDQTLATPVIQVEVVNQDGNPVPGVLMVVTWAGGEERFYTGLKSEINPGFADFTLNPEFVYNLRLGENGASLGNLEAVPCRSEIHGTYWGALKMKFGFP
jgi:hypothetical protein